MDEHIKEHILDYSIGNNDYWKSKFNCVLEDVQIHNPEMLVNTCFCDNNNNFNNYRRLKEIYIDIANLMEYIDTSKFKDKLIHDVLDILLNMNHPLYDVIECELARECQLLIEHLNIYDIRTRTRTITLTRTQCLL